jgi:broad specificity phosphatase PhoE
MSLLALIRHGPTAWTQARRLQGRADTELSPAGRAEVAGWTLPPLLETASWVSSPLARARQTAALIAPPPVAIEPRLIELDWGAWQGRTLAQLRASEGALAVDRNPHGRDFRPPQGETPREVWARVRPWVAEIARIGRTVAAVTHRGLIRALYAEASGWDMTGPAPAGLSEGAAHLFLARLDGTIAVIRINLDLRAGQGTR